MKGVDLTEEHAASDSDDICIHLDGLAMLLVKSMTFCL